LKKIIVKRIIKRKAKKLVKKIEKKKLMRRTTCAKKQSIRYLVATLKKREKKRGINHFKIGSIHINAKSKAVKDMQKIMKATKAAYRNRISAEAAKRIIKKIRMHAKNTVDTIMARVRRLR